MAARVEHAHHRRRQADEQHVGKHHAQQPQHEFPAGVKLMHSQRDGDADHDQRDDDARGDNEAGNDGVGRAPHFLFAVDFFLFLENRDERRRQRAFAEQPAEQIGNREGILERVVDPADVHERHVDHFAHHAEQAAGERGGGHRAGRLEHLRHRAKLKSKVQSSKFKVSCRSASCPNSQHVRLFQPQRIEDNPRSASSIGNWQPAICNLICAGEHFGRT